MLSGSYTRNSLPVGENSLARAVVEINLRQSWSPETRTELKTNPVSKFKLYEFNATCMFKGISTTDNDSNRHKLDHGNKNE